MKTLEEIKKIINEEINKQFKEKIISIKRFDFKDVEALLRFYPTLVAQIKILEIDLEEYRKNGLIYNSGTIKDIVVQCSKEFKSDFDKIEETLEKKEKRVSRYKSLRDKIEVALNSLTEKEDIKIVELRYFKRKSLDEVALELNSSLRTVQRKKSEILEKIKIILFG